MDLRLGVAALVAGLTFSAGGAGIAQAHDIGVHFNYNGTQWSFAFSGHSSVACGGVHRRASVMKMTDEPSTSFAQYRRGTTFVYEVRAYEENEVALSTCGDRITHVRACENLKFLGFDCTTWRT